MPSAKIQRSGARVLVDQLKLHGVTRAYGVPGESYLGVLDALNDVPEIAFTICRQEGGAAMMAEAEGKLTGAPGICFVTRGPGATNASAGLHIAFQDSTPMILFIGQIARGHVEREAFQEIDYRRMFDQQAKWVAQIDDAARIPEFLSRAFYTATSGRPGPVVLALPEDMLTDEVEVADAAPYRRVETHPGGPELSRLTELLAASERPFLLVGGSAWNEQATKDLQAFAEAQALPVGAAFRCQDLIDNGHPNYAGDVGIGVNPKLRARIQAADLLLVLGARLGEITSGGYTLIQVPRPIQKLVHIHPGAEELGQVYQPELAIHASPRAFLAAACGLNAAPGPTRAAEVEAAHRDYRDWSRPLPCAGALQMAEIVAWLRDHLPEDAVLTNGAGNYSVWLHRFFRFSGFRSQLGPTSGSMGYGLPAAIAAKAAEPGRPAICFAGDGCFLMTGQELATAVQYRLNVIILVVNNGMYGTIRMHQEREYPGRVLGTDLANPDFAALARAYGAHGEVVERTEDFAAAFERAEAAGVPALLELRIDPEALTPRQSLSEIRAAAEAAQGE
ncbi:MAG: thiamine pyrophosphate-binding protein [Kiloniellales bacterium]|nr:thiamine pyrophosphate-binding protein [Kiloniellales bacterium]